MLIVLTVTASGNKKRDPSKYHWYIMAKGRAKFESAHDEFDLTLSSGDKFGLKFFRGSYFLVDASDLSVQFKLSVEEASKLMKSAKPFSGKVAGKQVEGGETRSKPDRDKGLFNIIVQQKGGKFHTESGYKTVQAAQRAANKLIDSKTVSAHINTTNGKGKKASFTSVKSYSKGKWANVIPKKESEDTELDKLEDQMETLHEKMDVLDVDSASGLKKYNALKAKLSKLRVKIEQLQSEA